MDREFYLKVAQEYIDSIGEDEFYCQDCDNEFSRVFAVNTGTTSISFSVMSGATKVVLINDNYDYVIKIPLRGNKDYYSKCEHSWRCPPEIERPNECWSCKFIHNDLKRNLYTGAINDKEVSWDYCASEVMVYNQAKKNQLENFFLETLQIGEYGTTPIYLQKRATEIGFDNCEFEPSKESRESFLSIQSSRNQIPISSFFGACLIENHGKNECEKLFKFLKDESINDLHETNVGFLNEHPVLVDFSGFRG